MGLPGVKNPAYRDYMSMCNDRRHLVSILVLLFLIDG